MGRFRTKQQLPADGHDATGGSWHRRRRLHAQVSVAGGEALAASGEGESQDPAASVGDAELPAR
jgi:hypothetical protein